MMDSLKKDAKKIAQAQKMTTYALEVTSLRLICALSKEENLEFVETHTETGAKIVTMELDGIIEDAIQIVLDHYLAGLVHLLPQDQHLLAGQLVEMA